MNDANMHSLGDSTLALFMNLENNISKLCNSRSAKDLGELQNQASVNVLRGHDESNIEEYFKDSIVLSKRESENVKVDDKSASTSEFSKHANDVLMQDESDIGKYFKDSILLSGISIKQFESKNVKSKLNSSNKRKYACRKEMVKIDKITEENINTETLEENNETATNIAEQSRMYNNLNHNVGDNCYIDMQLKNIANSTAIESLIENVDKCSVYKFNDAEVIEKNEINHVGLNKEVDEKSNIMQCSATYSNSDGEPSVVHTQDRCKLSAWGLPRAILEKYKERGVTSMFPWQVECLSNRQVIEENQNLIYSAPTSAGKTLVAEILVIKTVLERRKKVIFILPFVSVVREKMFYFQDLLSTSGIRVEGFMGDTAPAGGFAATHIAIATIEKANSLVNRLMEEGNLVTLGAVVIDELHLLGDPNRGYLLELLLTKLKYMTLREEYVNVQLIGMSATLPNLSLLAKWLNAELYKTEFRPIPLNEQCKIGTIVYDNKLQPVRKLIPFPDLSMDTDNIFQLCIETIADGHSVLIFCPTKNWCEKLAHQIAATFFKLGSKETRLGQILKEQLNSAAIIETLEQLKRSPIGLDNVLKNTISFGVAFHHAGLTMDERDIIEGSFRTGSLRVLIATSTLSSGVNLPARRVIIRSPMFHGKQLDTLTYKQMIGRAGRMGKDTAGESILVCKSNERSAAESLLAAALEPIESCLEGSGPLIRALLEAVASEVAYTPADVDLYIKCTLISLSEEENVEDSTKNAIQFLVDNEFFLLQKTENGDQRWVSTPLGKACLASSISPREGLFLFEELQKARKCFALDTELHIVYLVTPFNSGSQIGQIDWMIFLELWKTLTESERRVGQLVGVEERFVMSAIRGIIKPGKLLNIHRRFYTALALHDLVREVSLATVCKKYGCCRGVLQSLQQSAATFAGMMTQFCKQLGWNCMELLVAQFQTRLQFGVCRELLDLLRLPMLNGLRARSLYKEGITSVAELATANELDVERALYKAVPFESEKEQNGEHETETAKRNKMRTIFVTGRDGLTPHQAAVILVQEARTLVQNELGIEEVQWKQYEQIANAKMQTKFCKSFKSQGFNQISSTNLNSNTSSNCYAEDVQTYNDVQREKSNLTTDNTKINNPVKKSIEASLSEDNFNEVIKLEKNKDNINCVNKDAKLVSAVDKITRTSRCSSDTSNCTSSEITPEHKNKLRHSESLINCKIIKNQTQKHIKYSNNKENLVNIDASTKCHFEDEETDMSSSISPVSSNRKWSSPGKSLKVNLKRKLSSLGKNEKVLFFKKETLEEHSNSRSPNLFDDSLHLDTQVCNILEQNINSSLDIPTVEEINVLGSTSSADILDNESPDVNQYIDHKTVNQFLASQSPSSKVKVLKDENERFFWNDDTWNNSKEIVNMINKLNDKKISKSSRIYDIKNSNDLKINNIVPECKILKNKNISSDLDITEEITSTPVMKNTNRTKSILCKSRTQNIRNIRPMKDIILTSNSQKRKCSEIDTESEKSPIASMLTFVNNRKLSIDLNKSDSDDIIVASQSSNSCISTSKSRTRLKLETTRRTATKKVLKCSTKKADTDKSNKIKEVPLCSFLTSENCSTDSIVLNSDEDTPMKKLRTSKASKNTVPFIEHLSKSEKPDWNVLDVINVVRDKGTFNLFKRELKQKTDIAFALACERFERDTINIGTKIIENFDSEGRKKSRKHESYVHGETRVCGAAFSWGRNVVYYISFDNMHEKKVPVKERMTLLTDVLSVTSLKVRCFASKEVYKTLYQCCGITPSCTFLDPKIAAWLLNAEALEKNFSALTAEYFPQGLTIMQRTDAFYSRVGPGLYVKSTTFAESRATAEAAITWYTMEALLKQLNEQDPILLYAFKEIEMKTVSILARMELTGLGVNLESLQELSSVIQREISSLEHRAFSMAGRKFNFSSSKDVAQVLGIYKGKKVSTNKMVLERCSNPISNLVISWRKLNATQAKMVLPLLQLAQGNSRIRGNCVTHTVTGRISMHEPNLQNVPRDFNSEDKTFVISVRTAFVPAIGNIILSADYCQLELRILAHYSKDTVLCSVMQKVGDVFKSIAAKWNRVPEEKVDDEMRQRTKQLCYGMIYGMGVRALAEHLSVTELEAKEFMETFMNTYPGIRRWLNETVEQCKADGYVTTLMERRRLLPGLNSESQAEKSQAERQAINTKIQGTAADLAKKAMVTIQARIQQEFPSMFTVFPEITKRRLRSNSGEAQPKGGYLILQLHDELVYEVNAMDLHHVATIIKESMEHVYQLVVPLPVRIKVGPTWGDLTEYKLDK